MTNPPAPLGFNVFGFFASTHGISVATRANTALIERCGWPLSVTHVPTPQYPTFDSPEFASFERPFRSSMPHGINIFHMQPPSVIDLLRGRLVTQPSARRLSAVVPFWELTRLPSSWIEQLDATDFVLAPSLHIKSIVEREAPNVPTLHFPQGVEVPDDVKPDRARWGLNEDALVFLSSFDVLSDPQRKNPVGAVKAFRAAFQSDVSARLIIKMRNADADERYRDEVASLRRTIESDPRILLIEDDLAADDLLTLFASADVFVSLHRAEGLGLMLMECMLLGVPLIATGWSGNMDFTAEGNTALIPYSMVPANGLHDYYDPAYLGGPAEWAEPDVGEAARWMRAFADDRDLARRMGAQARADALAFTADANRRGAFDALAQAYEGDFLGTERHATVSATAAELRLWAVKRALSSPWKIPAKVLKALKSR